MMFRGPFEDRTIVAIQGFVTTFSELLEDSYVETALSKCAYLYLYNSLQTVRRPLGTNIFTEN